ncbi:MAG TPA: dihydroorotase [Chloroflexota bacterium]|nr:dihydroorotase [Chloroflexota bacterium]
MTPPLVSTLGAWADTPTARRPAPAHLLIVGGRVLDPASGLDRFADVRVRDGRIAAIEPGLAAADGEAVLDARGCVVAPGFVDLHCHLGEPGYEDRETLATGTRAAAAGGFTTVCCMGDTQPRLDCGAEIAALRERAAATGIVRVLPIGCVTRGREGGELAELGELAAAGAVAFSDDARPVRSSRLLRHALAYSAMLGRPVVEHAVDPELAEGGLVHEGPVATWLGLPGVPAAAEEIAVGRAIALARLTGGRLHLAHLSTAGAVAQVRAAQAEGLAVTAEVTPHHLLLTADVVRDGPAGRPYDTSTRLDPPLRSAADAAALLAAVADGTIAAVATDHRPQRQVDKDCEYAYAAPGATALETALGALMELVATNRLSLPVVIRALTSGPAALFGLDAGRLAVGGPADLVVFDPDAVWTVEPARFHSRGKSTPLAGRTLRGRVRATLVGGAIVFSDE